MSRDLHSQTQQAEILLKLGMRPFLIHIQTGLSETRISSRGKQLREQGVEIPLHRGKIKTSESIIKKRSSHTEAIAFLLIYLRYAEKPGVDIKNDAVVQGYLHYQSNAQGVWNSEHRQPISINECWMVARDYREGKLSFTQCSRCEDGWLIKYADELASRCPSCAIKGAPAKDPGRSTQGTSNNDTIAQTRSLKISK